MKSEAEPAFDPKVFLAKADGGRTVSKYQRNDTIFTQGDPADSVFYIQRGKAKVTVSSAQGKEAVVAILGPDEFCGEGCLAGQRRRMATATAMTDAEIMRVGLRRSSAAAFRRSCRSLSTSLPYDMPRSVVSIRGRRMLPKPLIPAAQFWRRWQSARREVFCP